MGGIALQPALNAPAVVLLAPQQARQGRVVDEPIVGVQTRQAVLHVGLPLLLAGLKQGIKSIAERC